MAQKRKTSGCLICRMYARQSGTRARASVTSSFKHAKAFSLRTRQKESVCRRKHVLSRRNLTTGVYAYDKAYAVAHVGLEDGRFEGTCEKFHKALAYSQHPWKPHNTIQYNTWKRMTTWDPELLFTFVEISNHLYHAISDPSAH